MTSTDKKAFINFSPPLIGEEEIQEVVDTLRSGWLTTGPKTSCFEENFSKYTESKHALALNSCTAGLHLALAALKVGPGDEVITTPFTFCATANVIEHVGARPIFVDINPDTLNINKELINSAITDRTRAIIPVHYAGRPCDMKALENISAKREIPLIEDAAHCTEGISQDRKIGSISRFTCFSFYATKNLCTGEGGMITVQNDEDAELIRVLRLHGMSRDAWKRNTPGADVLYDVHSPGFKYNMTDIQAAIGIHQLKKLHKHLKRREEIFEMYDHGLKDLPLVLPSPVKEGDRHARHIYNVLLTDEAPLKRADFIKELTARGVGSAVHFTALHQFSYYQEKYGYKPEDYPVASDVSARTVSLPLSPALTDAQIERVIETVIDILS